LVLDFLGGVTEVVSQPFWLRFTAAGGRVGHVPDFLAVTGAGVWLIDVRPAGRVGEGDRVKFAASAEAALACGWRYLLVTGWLPHVPATVDTLSSQRRPLADPLGLRPQLVAQAAAGPRSFGSLAATAGVPPVARAQLLHLLWWRRLGIDLTRPLGDAAPVWPAGGVGG
jgi:hypothetical protein